MPDWTDDEWVEGVLLVAEWEAVGEAHDLRSFADSLGDEREGVREAALSKAKARWGGAAKRTKKKAKKKRGRSA